jgi:capsular polysaccharide biosynthesis protein
VLFGTLLSMMLAVGLALLRDWMDPSVKTAAQAERLAGLPVLGELQA